MKLRSVQRGMLFIWLTVKSPAKNSSNKDEARSRANPGIL